MLKPKDYIYKNFKIYKRTWLKFCKSIDDNVYSQIAATRKIKQLCGIAHKTVYSNLVLLPISNDISGRFLTNFKISGPHFLNDPFPAQVSPYKNRLKVQWENGHSCVTDASNINIYKKRIITGNKMINLGDTVRDTITGFKGTAVAKTTWIHGCDRVTVQPTIDNDGKLPSSECFDIMQLECLTPSTLKKKTSKRDPGGPTTKGMSQGKNIKR